MFYAIYMATRPRGFALVLVPVYFIKHSASCYIYYIYNYYSHVMQVKKQEDRNGKLQGHLVMLREILVTMFKEVPLPGTFSVVL